MQLFFVQDQIDLAQTTSHYTVQYLRSSPSLRFAVILVLVHRQGWHHSTIYLYRPRFAWLGLACGSGAGLGNANKNNTRCRAAVLGLWRRIP